MAVTAAFRGGFTAFLKYFGGFTVFGTHYDRHKYFLRNQRLLQRVLSAIAALITSTPDLSVKFRLWQIQIFLINLNCKTTYLRLQNKISSTNYTRPRYQCENIQQPILLLITVERMNDHKSCLSFYQYGEDNVKY